MDRAEEKTVLFPLGHYVPYVIVLAILQRLDLHSILQCRQVCKSWNKSITSVYGLWKQFCKTQPVIVDTELPLPRCYYFHLFLESKRILSRLAKDKWQTVMEIRQAPSEEAIQQCYENVLNDPEQEKFLKNILDPSTNNHLSARDHHPDLFFISKNLFLTVSSRIDPSQTFGHLHIATMDGAIDCLVETDLLSVSYMDVHSSGRFFIRAGNNHDIRLITKTFKEIKVCLNISDLDRSLSHSYSCHVFFLPDTDLAENHLALCCCSCTTLTVAIITHEGVIIQQQNFEFGNMSHVDRQTPNEFLVIRDDSRIHNIAKLRIDCSNRTGRSINVDIVWQWKLSQRHLLEANWSGCGLAYGKKFFMALDFLGNILIFKRGRRKVFAVVEEFFERDVFENLCPYQIADSARYSISTDGTCTMMKTDLASAVIDRGWLDGLSPSTTSSRVPIIIYRTKRTVKCLYWSPTLWTHLLEEREEGIFC